MDLFDDLPPPSEAEHAQIAPGAVLLRGFARAGDADWLETVNREVRATRGGGHDSPADEITATQRGRYLSRNPRAGHHNLSFRCAR